MFPLFVKPDYAKDAAWSQYLDTYLKYLSSDLVQQLPGLDSRYLSSLSQSLKNTLELSKAIESGSLDSIVENTRTAINNFVEGKKKKI